MILAITQGMIWRQQALEHEMAKRTEEVSIPRFNIAIPRLTAFSSWKPCLAHRAICKLEFWTHSTTFLLETDAAGFWEQIAAWQNHPPKGTARHCLHSQYTHSSMHSLCTSHDKNCHSEPRYHISLIRRRTRIVAALK